MVRRAAEIAEDGRFWTDQFNNADSIDGYRRIGEELVEQLPGPPALAAFCSYVGTAGCLLGDDPCATRSCSRSFSAWRSNRRSRPCSPAASLVLTTSRGAGSATRRRSLRLRT